MLNLASFGPDDHQMLMQAAIDGLRDILALDLDAFRERVARGAHGAEAGRPERISRSPAGGSRPEHSRTDRAA